MVGYGKVIGVIGAIKSVSPSTLRQSRVCHKALAISGMNLTKILSVTELLYGTEHQRPQQYMLGNYMQMIMAT